MTFLRKCSERRQTLTCGLGPVSFDTKLVVIDDAESALSKFKTVQNAWQIKSSLVFELTTLGFSLVRKSSQALNFDGYFVGAALQQHCHDDNTAVLSNAAYRLHLRIFRRAHIPCMAFAGAPRGRGGGDRGRGRGGFGGAPRGGSRG